MKTKSAVGCLRTGPPRCRLRSARGRTAGDVGRGSGRGSSSPCT